MPSSSSNSTSRKSNPARMTQRFFCVNYAVISRRFRLDLVLISRRFRLDLVLISRRFRLDLVLISRRFRVFTSSYIPVPTPTPVYTPSPSTPHPHLSQAKQILFNSIDRFLNQNIVLAAQAISKYADSKIQSGDVILIYAW